MIEQILDQASEGLIAVDGDARITCYNQKAKEIFGIDTMSSASMASHQSHPPGKLEAGDYVLIADTGLGVDDGVLRDTDLLCIGIRPGRIAIGQAFCAIGRYDGHTGHDGHDGAGPAMKFDEAKVSVLEAGEKVVELEESIAGKHIRLRLDAKNRVASIEVGGEAHIMPYIRSVGHMVVLSANGGTTRFYQQKGYTARREDIRNLLEGGLFKGKGMDAEDYTPIGKSLHEIHPLESNMDMMDFIEVAKGNPGGYAEQVKEINGRLTRCTLTPLGEGNRHLGALLKVEDITELDMALKERDEAIASLNALESAKADSGVLGAVIGQSGSMNHVKMLAGKAAASDATVLILGESGTGKGLLAECIHKASIRRDHPFVSINCGAIPQELLESELFGYKGGAFTGALKEGKPGLFERAEGGTLFLDEIGEMPLLMQVKLLHVLQGNTFTPVGATEAVKVDVRIICATNVDLEQKVREGKFRKDLFYRIHVFPIVIPALRERRSDIYLLAMSLLPKICTRSRKEMKKLSGTAYRILQSYDWPGNVRELENVLERAANLADGDVLFGEHFDSKMMTESLEPTPYEQNAFVTLDLDTALADSERRIIQSAIQRFGDDRKAAMKALGIKKTAFYYKLKKYGIE